jgi:aldose sugar dehydrogenase
MRPSNSRSSSGRMPALSTAALLLLLSAGPPGASAQAGPGEGTGQLEVHVDTIVRGLEHPWGLALLPDGRFLVTERNPGTLRLGDAEGNLSEPLAGVPDIFRYDGPTERSQAGLFDVRLHPAFEQNRLVYLSLSAPTPRGAALAVVRGRLVGEEEGARPRLEGVEEVFVMKEEDQDASGLHFGGRIAFEPDGAHLYLSAGERRNLSRAQDLEDQAGSILRMTEDGRPAPGNPFAEGDEADPYLWSWGHRNPQGMTVDTRTGELWIADHGPERGDGLYLVEVGANHGWPLFTEGEDYSGAPLGHDQRPADVVAAAHIFDETVAPSGLAIYRGDAFPEWDGHLLLGGLVTRAVHVLERTTRERVTEVGRLGTRLDRRIRDVQVAEDGSIWVITEHEDGEVLRLRPGAATGPN